MTCDCAEAMSSDAVAAARKGRLKQRYDNEFRLVAGSVPSAFLVGCSGARFLLCRSTILLPPAGACRTG
jgi:hypothetical protein